MTEVTALAPARVDLAGGSLDLWPLGLCVEGSATVNVAVGLYAEARLVPGPAEGLRLGSEDYGARYLWRPGAPPGALPLLERFCAHHGVTAGWSLETRAGSPPGAGLGGSSAMSVALDRALGTLSGQSGEAAAVVARCRDLEAAQLRIPTGVQDFWPALLGGVLCIQYRAGGEAVRKLCVDLDSLAEHLLVVYGGRSRLSAGTNWALYKAFLDGEPAVRRALEGIAAAARDMVDALEAAEWASAAGALEREMDFRAGLSGGILTPETEALFAAGRRAGALGAKVCGAGGGGCSVFLVEPDRRRDVAAAVHALGGRVLEAPPVEAGCSVEVVP